MKILISYTMDKSTLLHLTYINTEDTYLVPRWRMLVLQTSGRISFVDLPSFQSISHSGCIRYIHFLRWIRIPDKHHSLIQSVLVRMPHSPCQSFRLGTLPVCRSCSTRPCLQVSCTWLLSLSPGNTNRSTNSFALQLRCTVNIFCMMIMHALFWILNIFLWIGMYNKIQN